MEINLTQEKLLCERGVIVLPETIEHETYEMVLALLMLAETEWTDKPIRLFCAGHGGSATAALALADLVRSHRVVGMLAGMAESAHVTVFAACQERYVFPMAQIGIHRLSWHEISSRQDAQSLRYRQMELETLEAEVANLLATACDDPEYDYFWWLELLHHVGSGSCELYGADWMRSVGMARRASEYGAADTLVRTLQRASGGPVSSGREYMVGPVGISPQDVNWNDFMAELDAVEIREGDTKPLEDEEQEDSANGATSTEFGTCRRCGALIARENGYVTDEGVLLCRTHLHDA